MKPELPEPLQELYESLQEVLLATQEGEGKRATLMVLEELVAPYRTAQQAYAASHGIYRAHPAWLVRSKGDGEWSQWPDTEARPSLLDLTLMIHAKKNDPAESQEDT